MSVVKKVLAGSRPALPVPRPPRRDPWYSDDDRKRAVNDASPRNAARRIPRRAGWLRRGASA